MPSAIGVPRTTYTPAQIEDGLHALALLGSANKAEQQTGIPNSTLTEWRRHQHTERYEQIRVELMPKIHAEMASRYEDVARESLDLQFDLLAQVKDKKDQLSAKDTATALNSVAVQGAVATDKAAMLRGQPTQIIRHDIHADIRALIARGVAQPIEADAEEVHEAQLVEP